MEKLVNFVTYEPKQNNRFEVIFGEPFKIPQYVVYETNRPRMTSLGEWDDMVFSMWDPIGPSTSHAIINGVKELIKREEKFFNVTLNIFDPIGSIVETWVIRGFIDSIDFGNLKYDDSSKLVINLYFKTLSVNLIPLT